MCRNVCLLFGLHSKNRRFLRESCRIIRSRSAGDFLSRQVVANQPDSRQKSKISSGDSSSRRKNRERNTEGKRKWNRCGM